MVDPLSIMTAVYLIATLSNVHAFVSILDTSHKSYVSVFAEALYIGAIEGNSHSVELTADHAMIQSWLTNCIQVGKRSSIITLFNVASSSIGKVISYCTSSHINISIPDEYTSLVAIIVFDKLDEEENDVAASSKA
jgi:hypothetical protein